MNEELRKRADEIYSAEHCDYPFGIKLIDRIEQAFQEVRAEADKEGFERGVKEAADKVREHEKHNDNPSCMTQLRLDILSLLPPPSEGKE